MTNRREPVRSQFPPPPSNPQSRPLRVDPFAPFPTTSPLSQPVGESASWPEEVQMNSIPSAAPVARTASRRRRVSGTGSGNRKSQVVEYHSQPPAAPEVPRGPPVSYRESYTSNGTSPTMGNPTSFAARARGYAEEDQGINPGNMSTEPEPEPIIPNIPQNPRRSANGHSRTAKSERSDRREESRSSELPKPLDGVRIKQSTSAKAPRQRQVTEPYDSQAETDLPEPEIPSSPTVVPARASTQRSSAGAADPRKEWAPDRSPLQKLEVKLNDISKEEKRARVEKAERKMRERQAEEARRKHDQALNPGANSRQVGEVTMPARDSTKPTLPKEVLESQPRQKDRRSKDRPVAPTYVEDIDQQQLERRQLPPSQKVAPISASSRPVGNAQGSRKPDPNDANPQQQVGRGVRFESNNSSEENINDVTSRPRKWPQQSPDRPVSNTPSSKPQQSIRQRELAQGATKSKEVPVQQQNLYSSKAQPSGDLDDPAADGGAPDPVPRSSVRAQNGAVKYEIPPQTAAGIEARQKVGFGGDPAGALPAPVQRHRHHLSKILHHDHAELPPQTSALETQPRHLDEWRQGGTARLTSADFVNEPDSSVGKNAWWEGGESGGQRVTGYVGGNPDDYEQERKVFNPPLYLKCGPLLRYTGMKRDRLQNPRTESGTSTIERETWRGSVMIVTIDAESTYNPAPTLRLSSEPVDLLPPPPLEVNGESGHNLPPEYIDPIAGLPKLTRRGGTVYVKPAEDLDQEVDLSRIETDDGLFEETRTANVPTSYGMPKLPHSQSSQSKSAKSRAQRRDRSRGDRGQSVRGVRLHAERGVTFWRFNLEVELTTRQSRIGYSINNAPSVGFWVPARGQSMNVMFHSCNGFSMSVNSAVFSGPDPLWRDVLNSHQSRPFHVMIGGGDQIYNDAVMSQTKLFQEWLEIKNPHHKHEVEFSLDMQEELESFYLDRYAMWFSQGLFGMANSQIPMVNMWDDHDIIDGFGSYPHHFMSNPVFCGLGAVAFKYYMLFQHQSVPNETPADEPSWLLGAAPGPYINELSRSIFLSLGKHVAFLALDCRTERMREDVVSEATYDLVFDRCRREIIEGETKHLIVLLGVPIAYPRLVWLENLLTSRVMDPVKALGRAGMLGGFLNKFDGGVEILDDLDDHWTAKNHKRERNFFIQELQELASEKSVRVTILGGDVHLAAVGQFYSNPKLKIRKDQDHRYMANVVSSAIVNTPPPDVMGDILNKRNKTHHLDRDTDENMIPMFTHDVDGKPRNNKRLLPRRNWCSIREYHPGSTPPPTPSNSGTEDLNVEPPTRPGVLQRTLSTTRADMKPGNLIRRLSQRDNQGSAEYPLSNEYQTSPTAEPSLPGANDGSPSPPKRRSAPASSNANALSRFSSAPLPRPGNFHRRPTNMSFKAIKKGGALEDDNEGHINLEHGLDIVLNCEVSQKDPAGITVPYRLLVPALFYDGPEDVNEARYRKQGLLERFGSLRGGRRKSQVASNQGQGNWGKSQDSFTQTDSQSHSEMSEQQWHDDAVGRGGALGRLKRSLSGRGSGRRNLSQEHQAGGPEGRVEGMGVFPRRPSVAKKDISAPQLQRDTVSAEAISGQPREANGLLQRRTSAAGRAAAMPQKPNQATTTSTITTTVTSGQPPQRNSSTANRVEGMGLFPRRQSTTTRPQSQIPQQTQPQSAPASQPLGLRMMEDRAEQQRQQSSNYDGPSDGYPGRRPSKLNRILGIGHSRDKDTADSGQSFAARDAARQEDEYSTEGEYSNEYSYEESIGPEEGGAEAGKGAPAKGYGGIEAYKEGKGWKRLLGAKGKALVG